MGGGGLEEVEQYPPFQKRKLSGRSLVELIRIKEQKFFLRKSPSKNIIQKKKQ